MSVYLRLLAERAQSAIETLDAIGDFQSVASRDDAVEISPPGPDGGHR